MYMNNHPYSNYYGKSKEPPAETDDIKIGNKQDSSAYTSE
jgi:hypothetical protein